MTFDMERYRDEIERAFAEAAKELSELPAGPGGVGLALLNRANPLREGGIGATNAISYLLPHWLRERDGGPIGLSRDMAVGNLYAMLRFFVLDDAMDGGGDRIRAGLRSSLALSELLQGLFQRRYESWFPRGSELWVCYRRYVREWAVAVHAEAASPIGPLDVARLSAKAAPVKISAAAHHLHAGRPDRLPETERAIELALAVLQLSDDWADWREDLADANRNALLSIVRDVLELPADAQPDERAAKRAIYHRGAVNRLAAASEIHAAQLRGMPGAPGALADFASAIALGIRRGASETEETVRRLAIEGGLANFLSNRIKNR